MRDERGDPRWYGDDVRDEKQGMPDDITGVEIGEHHDSDALEVVRAAYAKEKGPWILCCQRKDEKSKSSKRSTHSRGHFRFNVPFFPPIDNLRNT